MRESGLHIPGAITGPAWLRDSLVVAVLAAILALPWIDERFVPCMWLGLAIPLAAVQRLRGWRGETIVLASAALALAIAFHWAPAVLAKSLNTSAAVGLLVTVPVVIWDAMRFAVPLWFASRTVRDPLRAWLPAGLVAAFVEWLVPAVFPWKVGYSQIYWHPLVQSADLLGPEFTTFIAFAHAGLLVWAGRALLVMRRRGAGMTGDLVAPLALAPLVLCVANLAYGIWAERHWSAAAAAAPRLRVGVVQVDPTPEDATADLRRLTLKACEAARAGSAAGSPFDLLVWPECSGGSYEASLTCLADEREVWKFSRDPNRGLRPLAAPECPLLFGGKVFSGEPEKPRRLHQSAILIDRAERIVARYHKRHLMPFGEYMPGGEWLRDIKLLFPMEDEFHEGTEATVLPMEGGARLGVMLCYEDMVPAAATSLAKAGANLLVSLINGSAFTERLTLRQHRLLAQLRAVECRRAFVRCAATGETCIIDPVGTIDGRLPLHVQDVLVGDVPLLETRTLAVAVGPAFPLAAAAAVVAGLAWSRLGRSSRRSGAAGAGGTIVDGSSG